MQKIIFQCIPSYTVYLFWKPHLGLLCPLQNSAPRRRSHPLSLHRRLLIIRRHVGPLIPLSDMADSVLNCRLYLCFGLYWSLNLWIALCMRCARIPVGVARGWETLLYLDLENQRERWGLGGWRTIHSNIYSAAIRVLRLLLGNDSI